LWKKICSNDEGGERVRRKECPMLEKCRKVSGINCEGRNYKECEFWKREFTAWEREMKKHEWDTSKEVRE